MRVLVAEDFETLAHAVATGLRREGMAVDVVLDGDEALERLAYTPYDIVILDRDLPGVHGDEVCRQVVVTHPATRVLMLTAASTVRQRVDGLCLGADDYLPKPFDFAELVARIRALGRRPTTALPPILENGDLSVDPSRRVASRAGQRLELSPKEFAVLECLLAAQGRLVSAEELLERVWDEAADPFTTAVKTRVRRLPGECVTLSETSERMRQPVCDCVTTIETGQLLEQRRSRSGAGTKYFADNEHYVKLACRISRLPRPVRDRVRPDPAPRLRPATAT